MDDGLTLIWPGGEHRFRLTLGHLRALQKVCDASPFVVQGRLVGRVPYVDDVVQPLRLGLQGGGMDEAAARALVEQAIAQSGLMALVIAATAVLTSALVGPEDDRVGEPPGESPPATNGDFPSSTATGP